MRLGGLIGSTLLCWGRAKWAVSMTVEHGKSDQGDEVSNARVMALVRDAQRALGLAEQLLAEVERADPTLNASDLAARQAAIVDAAHEEAAVILAKAHADAARILEHAVSGPRVEASPAPAPADAGAGTVLDLRDEDSAQTLDGSNPVLSTPVATTPVTTAPVESPPVATAPATAPIVDVAIDTVDPDVRASLAAAADMARRVSGRIERLTQDLHQAPAL